MTLTDVIVRLAEIEAARNKGGKSHILADELHQDVLRAIAAGQPDAEALAAEALKSEEIEYDRWYE